MQKWGGGVLMINGIDGQRDGTVAHPQVQALKSEWNNLLILQSGGSPASTKRTHSMMASAAKSFDRDITSSRVS